MTTGTPSAALTPPQLSSAENGTRAGLVIDGTLWRLEGEPPVAQPGNWRKTYGS